MKKVTLYTIQEETRMVCDPGEFSRYCAFDTPPMHLPVAGEPREFMVVERDCPIRRVIKRGEELYIAIQPELEEVLMAPKIGEYEERQYRREVELTAVRSLCSEYEERQYRREVELNAVRSLCSGYESRIAGHNSLPWWKKIFTGRI